MQKNNTFSFFVKHKVLIFVFLIFIFGSIVRFYDLGKIPTGLYSDETAIGYNAYSILTTAKDEHGKSMPIYFESFGDFKFPLYIYLTAISEKFLGINEFSVRVWSALFGCVSVIFAFLLIRKISKRNDFALAASLFLAINPWNIFFSRAGFEVNVATALIIIGSYLFLKGLDKKHFFILLLSIICFVLSAYTYNVTRIFSPLILLILVILNFKVVLGSKKEFLPLFIIFLLSYFPLLLAFNTSGFSSHQEVTLLGSTTKSKIILMRSYLIDAPGVISKVFFNYWFLLGWEYLKNLVQFFSTNFFFVSGYFSRIDNISNSGMFYLFEFPLIIWGIYSGLKNRNSYLKFFFLWLILAILIVCITYDVPHPTRGYIVLFPFSVFSAYGFISLLELINKNKNKLIQNLIIFGMFFVILYSVVYYLASYFYRFPVEAAPLWRSEDKKVSLALKNLDSKYSQIYIDDSSDLIYTSVLFYQKYPPDLYQKEAVYERNGMLERPKSFGKYIYGKVDWKEQASRNTAIFVTGKETRGLEFLSQYMKFDYPTRPVVISYDGKVGQFPVTEAAYMFLIPK